MNDTCGIPNKANWYTQVIYSLDGQTSYTDVYSCDEHFPGYPDGSMSAAEAASMLRWDGHEQAEVLEWESTHLRDTEPETCRWCGFNGHATETCPYRTPPRCTTCHRDAHRSGWQGHDYQAPQCDSMTVNHACVLDAGHDGRHFDNGAEWGGQETAEFGPHTLNVDHDARTVQVFSDSAASNRQAQANWGGVCSRLTELGVTGLVELGNDRGVDLFTGSF